MRERATESAGEISERSSSRAASATQAHEFDRVVVNDDLERAVDEVGGILRDELGASCRYHRPLMIHPRIDELTPHVDTRYALVIVAAKRARQINNYHQQLGEGTFDDFPPPLVESRSKNYLTMSLEEIAQGKIRYEYRA